MPRLRGTARWIIRSLAAAAGIRPASIHDLYMAMGRGDAGGFTVPAINVRAMAYDTARAVIRVGEEAERRRVHLRDRAVGNRLHRAAAARIRGDRARARRCAKASPARSSSRAITSRPTRRSTTARSATRSSTTLRALIKEEIAAGFYNIDIDTSTLVDLDKPTLAEQQEVNVTLAADFAAFIREHEPQGVTVSVGGEIGEVGGKNSDVHELHAYMDGFNREAEGARRAARRPEQDQRADRHGARRLRQRRRHACAPTSKIDLKTLEELSRVARKDYGLGGAVQHGASTLPPEAFDAFPRVGACEIHLATDFQNMVYEHPQFPAELKAEMYAWCASTPPKSGSRRTPKSSSSTRRARRRSARSSSRCGASSRRRARAIGQIARGALHVPDEAAEDQRHRRGGREVRQGAASRARSRTRKSSPPAARSPPRRRKRKASPTERSPNPRAEGTTSRRSRLLNVVAPWPWRLQRRRRRPPHHHRSGPPRRCAAFDRHHLPRRLSRIHGRDGDAVRRQGPRRRSRSRRESACAFACR